MASPPAIGLVGNLNVDLLLGPVSEVPAWDREVLAEGMELRFAGTAGYIALAAHALGLPSVILSTVGEDLYGQFLLAELERNGLTAAGVSPIPGEPTPITAVTVGPGGSRAMVSVLGAHKHVSLGYYEQHKHLLSDCPEIFICGNYLLPNLDCTAALTIARDARSKGQRVYFDPSWDPTNWSQPVVDATLSLMPLVDVFLPNEHELCGLTGLSDWREAAARIGRLGPEVVVKRGAAGAAALVAGEWFEDQGLRVVARDTTGAGDVFDAAYLWARRQGLATAERLQWANAAAALLVEQAPRTHYPAFEEVVQSLRSTMRGTGKAHL